GVRKGCVLAPTLFSLYINDIVPSLLRLEADAPLLGTQKILVLLFADDTLLISKTPSGLHKLLVCFEEFCSTRGLEINASKTKLMTLNPHRSFRGKFTLEGTPLEKVGTFSY
ncbi:hypothetical protein NDU88_001082, partial [Pleurodeles waltl]